MLAVIRFLQVKDSSFDTLWRKLRDKCEIEDLHFHDSRHEGMHKACSEIGSIGFGADDGHKDLRSLMIYYNATASEIEAIKALRIHTLHA